LDRLAFRSKLGLLFPGVTEELVFPLKTKAPVKIEEKQSIEKAHHFWLPPIS
jgi:hypothetical protein